MDPLTARAPVLDAARVTLDVLHNGVIWGWYVTMNMWAKSLGTGVVLVGALLMPRHPSRRAALRLPMALVGLAFIGITLFFTWLDLHQKLRFWHMFVHPHFTSSINLGAWLLSAYSGVLALMLLSLWQRREAAFDRLLAPALVLAFFATIYTAALLGQQSAREIWSTPTEVAQTLLAALLAGSAALLLWPTTSDEERPELAALLGLSAAVSLTIFAAEVVLAPQKSEEAEYIIHTLTTGSLGALFHAGLLLGFVVPGLVALFARRSPMALRAAAVSSLVGLWMVKHAWLIAPQLLPLS